jgi:hypothetical protein
MNPGINIIDTTHKATAKIRLTDNDKRYLDQLQREVSAYKARLAEYDRITTGTTEDSLIRTIFAEGRGKIVIEIEQRRRSWSQYVFSDPEAVALLEV